MWVTSEPGQIRIRGYPIQSLAVEFTFLENISFLVNGNQSDPVGSRAWKRFMENSFEILKQRGGLLNRNDHLSVKEIPNFIDKVLNELNDSQILRKFSSTNKTAEAAFVWVSILSEFALHYDEHWWPKDPSQLIYSFARSLTSKKLQLRHRLVRAFEMHMSLQIESPNSPSSKEFRNALSTGASLLEAIRVGVERFWRADHGLASSHLANLLLKWHQNNESIEEGLEKCFQRGEKIPGFGSHEHKGRMEDPRVLVYRDKICKNLRSSKWFWKSAQELEKAFYKKYTRALLPLNPDHYMTLLHFELDIPPIRIPVSFLVARIAGWCAAYIEMKM